MIRPPGFAGAAFGTRASGDLRSNPARRTAAACELGIPADWAFVHQVHGTKVVEAIAPGQLGDGDAIVVATSGIPIAVATADCVPVVIEAATAVAVVHAGWRGAAAGVVTSALDYMIAGGHEPRRAAIGPAIGPCCYEVGPEVAAQFPGHVAQTKWGSASVDIPGYIGQQLAGLIVWRSSECTYSSERLYSWRRNGTKRRQVAVAWLPTS